MFFDLTPQVNLDQKNTLLYRKLRFSLYILSFLVGGSLAFRILFPSLFFEFSFNNPNAKTNTLAQLQNENGSAPEKGKLRARENTHFNASLFGSYSTATISFILDKKSSAFSSQNLEIRKSYAAFLYPEGDIMGFKNSTLLKNNSDYYIVSENKLRKFANLATMQKLGFPESGFVDVTEADLIHNVMGNAILLKDDYPNDALFFIDQNYYLLREHQLEKFISDNAYLSHHPASQAITQEKSFFEKYPVSNINIGFADGSLISYADSIYLVENNTLFPIDNPLTFSHKDFHWNDVKKAGADEVAFYAKGKLFTLANNHPSGTIFRDMKSNQYFLIQNEKKQLLPTENIYHSWVNTQPIIVSQKSLEVTSTCQPEKSLIHLDTFQCNLSLTDMQDLIGSDYLFTFAPENELILDFIRVEFKKDIGIKNLRFTLSEIINRIKNNYAQ